MIARTKRLGLLQLALALAAYLLVMSFAAPRYDAAERPQLYDAALSPEGFARAPAGTQTLRLSGASLYRVNTLWLNGRRVPLRFAEAVNYGECMVCVDSGLIVPGENCRVRIGKRFALVPWVVFRSNEITFLPAQDGT